MEKSKIVEELENLLKTSIILKDEPMKKHTSFKIGGIADIYIKANKQEEIKEIIKFTDKYNIPLTIVGNGSNILVTDKGIRGIVLEVALQEKRFEKQEDGVLITARGRC